LREIEFLTERAGIFPNLKLPLKAEPLENDTCSRVKCMGKTKKLKVTPILETGVTLEFSPENAPVPKTCHLMLRWAVEKCPICGSALMLYYCPTIKHEPSVDSQPGEEHKVVISCVDCSFIVVEKGIGLLGYPE
jgi:hypothetical protein